MKTNVAVIGAGVSGITTAIMLQYLGFQVSVYSKDSPLSSTKKSSFASQFPSASIIPHSVFHPKLDQIFSNSQNLFGILYNSAFPGIEIHEHFELFGYDAHPLNYTNQISGFKQYSEMDWFPKHPTIPIQSGWKFNCYFADWSIYFPYLIQKFLDNHGKFINADIDLNSFSTVKEEIIINCSGLGSHHLKDENKEPIILLGHLLKIADTPNLLSPTKNTVSYNFTPGLDVYSDSFGIPLDVYLYPRTKDWIMGGSRFKGSLDNNGDWVSKDILSEDFPHQIYALNAEILKHSFGIDMSSYSDREFQKAYRYVRNTENGLRIELQKTSDRLVIHNYGHGGAGVTLSWGAAFYVAEILSNINLIDLKSLEEVGELLTAK